MTHTVPWEKWSN